MPDKKEIIEQTNLAFNFVQKLYLEVSYLIKEMEAILKDEEERFVIGRSSGYSVTVYRSTGLESNNVKAWLFRKLAVFFVPEERTKSKGGQTITAFDNNLKVLYLRIILNSEKSNEPVVYSGVLHDIQKKPRATYWNKFEQTMAHIQYNDGKIFKNPKKLDYEDAHLRIKGELIKNNLFDINDSEAIVSRIIKPSLELYRKC